MSGYTGMVTRPYTEEQVEWIRENVQGISYDELTRRFNERFRENRTKKGIRGFCRRKGMLNGMTGYFEKGSEPANKGKKMQYKSEESRKRSQVNTFKPGQLPVGTMKIGDERLMDGYTYVKVNDVLKARAHVNWRPKQHLIYEQNHGPIKEDCIVVFLDNNKQNFDPNNLLMVHKRTLPYFLKYYGYSDDIEINRTNFLLSEVESTAVHMERNRK